MPNASQRYDSLLDRRLREPPQKRWPMEKVRGCMSAPPNPDASRLVFAFPNQPRLKSFCLTHGAAARYTAVRARLVVITMSRYLNTADYYWEIVVDGRSPENGFAVYLEERRTNRRVPLRTLATEREMQAFCRTLQRDLLRSEEEFESRHSVRLTSPPEPPP